jgi:hypothetical protein
VITKEDSLLATVNRQSPIANLSTRVQVGGLVDLFLGIGQPQPADSLSKGLPESQNNP